MKITDAQKLRDLLAILPTPAGESWKDYVTKVRTVLEHANRDRHRLNLLQLQSTPTNYGKGVSITGYHWKFEGTTRDVREVLDKMAIPEQPVLPRGVTTSTTGDAHERCGGIWQAADAYGLIDRCDKCGEERA